MEWIRLPRPDGKVGGLRARLVPVHGRLIIIDVHLFGEEIDANALGAVSITKIHAAAAHAGSPGREHRTVRPFAGDRDELYRSVADAYWHYAATIGRGAAVAIAAEVDVPPSTVHGWIREARRRGYLPPGRKGRTG